MSTIANLYVISLHHPFMAWTHPENFFSYFSKESQIGTYTAKATDEFNLTIVLDKKLNPHFSFNHLDEFTEDLLFSINGPACVGSTVNLPQNNQIQIFVPFPLHLFQTELNVLNKVYIAQVSPHVADYFEK